MTRLYRTTDMHVLLKACSLTVSDIKLDENKIYLGWFEEQYLAGCIGLELWKDVGLLRSLAVAHAWRKRGIGTLLVNEIELYGRLRKVKELYLLTTTAEPFFRAKNYGVVSRNLVPDDIKKTSQYAVICPHSAVILSKKLF